MANDEREKVIEAASKFCLVEGYNVDHEDRAVMAFAADFHLDMRRREVLQFNEAIPAMKEAYQQGVKDGRRREWCRWRANYLSVPVPSGSRKGTEYRQSFGLLGLIRERRCS